MKIVSYARVSTLSQEAKGESLPNQERAFTAWIAAGHHKRLRAYAEPASAGTRDRAELLRLLDDLPRLKPDAVIVDTLDRFTRNLRDGLNLLEEMRGHGVALLPIDWRRTRPINLDDDEDWRDVVDEFTDAEKERRRIRRRIIRSYQGRRERGATTVNLAPFGTRRQGDRLVPSEHAWIVKELDKRFLQGATIADLTRWSRGISPEAWRAISGVRRALGNPHYVSAGIRSVEDHTAIRDRLALRAPRADRVHEHEFAGVFACGKCLADGRAPADSVMTEVYKAKQAPQLVCQRRRDDPTLPQHSFNVAVHKVEGAWREYLRELPEDDPWIEAWGRAEDRGAEKARALERSSARLDQEAAAIKARRDAAFDLLNDPSPAIARQARRMLAEIDADETQLEVRRQALLEEAARNTSTARNTAKLREALKLYAQVYENAPLRTRNELNRLLCKTIGSHPRVTRIGKANRWNDNIVVTWPELDALRVTKGRAAYRPSSRE